MKLFVISEDEELFICYEFTPPYEEPMYTKEELDDMLRKTIGFMFDSVYLCGFSTQEFRELD